MVLSGQHRHHNYTLLDGELNAEGQSPPAQHPSRRTPLARFVMLVTLAAATASLAIVSLANPLSTGQGKESQSCDSVFNGYQCRPEISHFWGQYSPYFSVPSEISTATPSFCKVTFAQILSRHGERDPTASKTKAYNATIQKLHSKVKTFSGPYAFLADYEYTLGADQLTLFGEKSMIHSGIQFYSRYENLAKTTTPFVRSSGEDRVIESAQNWTMGFHEAKVADRSTSHGDAGYPYSIVVIPETDGSNNTLNHGTCTNFENGPDTSGSAQSTWAALFIPPIQARLNAGMPGANLSVTDTIYMMDLCPFNTVANENGTISPFCDLFSKNEWHQYAYYETLGKYYGYSYGNPMGPTQGVGFVNELIARLTDTPVKDETSTNHTLDGNRGTFPLGRKLYADFSHDNTMTAIFAAMGLYNNSKPLSNTTLTEASRADGYSAGWTVPFAARAYVEKLQCLGQREELVRVIVNDRVVPLPQCECDGRGLCRLSKFISSMGFAKANGKWDQCFS
ncbi:3-phytase A [Acrodontium crateriforme]|uniref:Phytase A n=1 Tax=Acrodontium crateriforme TaxID=150365 RepID=A0AAQ3LXE6_9PEZI|nr:3-phytase A [Acrodontium crateriforme]